MRLLTDRSTNSLLAAFASDIGEAMAVRRAARSAKAAQAEAEMSIRARAELLANMNHELRTPLNAIIGFATMLKDAGAYSLTEEQRAAYAGYVLQSADLLLAHVDLLLEAAALDSGTIAFESSSIDMGAALAEAVKRAKIAAEAANVVIEAKSAGPTALGWGDAGRIGQALDHLIRTAIRLSPKGGRIHARATIAKDGWAEVAVRDRSEGGEAQAIAQALSAAGAAHRVLDRSFSGPDVGLAIAKALVEMQGGRFAMKSRPGEGALVSIALPPPARTAAAGGELKLTG
jgi:signal transduction histidine kinase